MNVLKQIDECFINYMKIYGDKDIDSYWDDGIVVNKYIKLGNREKKNEVEENKIKKDNINENLIKNNEDCNKTNLNNEPNNFKKLNLNNENSNLSELNTANESHNINIKKKKENLFVCNDIVEKCICLNTIEYLEELKDATLVRWTCMIQQIISPESYLGIYKLKNKKNGEIIMKSSKYKDYIDTEENYEIIDDNDRKHYGEYYELNFEKYHKEKEDIEIDKEIRQNTKENEEIYVNNNNHKKEDCIDNNYNNIYFYSNDYNFKKYWKRYLFFCTSIPGNKSSWCKELCDYSSYHSNYEIFLKNRKNIEYMKNINNNDNYSICSTNISNYKNSDNVSFDSNNDNIKILKESNYNIELDTLKESINDDYKNSKSDNIYNIDKNISVNQKKGKIGCIIKIYDDNSQYNGDNANNFLKLNDIIEVIGIYRKHQIRDYDDYKKNMNFYFFYDQNFLKYPCIHVFQYTKINYFNPLNNCILFTNELSNILENGPFKDINELRKYLLIYISRSFSNDLLVAHYFFFYLCGNYIKESKLKLGKISLNIFNIDYKEEKCPEHKVSIGENDTDSLNDVKNEFIKDISNEIFNSKKESRKVFKNNENEKNLFQKNAECNLNIQENCQKESKKSYPKHARKMNKMIKNLIPLYRYIPLILRKLSSKYLVSVMNHKFGELEKGKLQLANNTYVAFDECLLEVGKLNNISLKNFQCIERLIVSQEIPFIFNTDITFETQSNILILSKKQSMFKNYIDITIPILHSQNMNYNENKRDFNLKNEIDKKKNNINNENRDKYNQYKDDINENEKDVNQIFSKEFINTNKNYKPSENELMQFRRYVNYLLLKNNPAKIHPDITNYITESFVSLRQKNKEVNQFLLNSWICMSRILAFSDGFDEIKKDHWNYIMKLENERRLRMNHLNKLYI
ncbi:conserved Plasmodium protein, unknown function [Plasmodium relictum]|uniref:Mini-chromosome maintenance complex-binding protein n=1 Tax=Plasmodium relictum TaxID=85471 RepID=A0A1J1HF38_PLARL|nr:conserved Plasmodium protein, unknown function [Plasmodium relictum]CRH04016.1 conserved Plasmodium protein, unknown function [Plasmodium relictum]